MDYQKESEIILEHFIAKGKDSFYYFCVDRLHRAYAEGFKKGTEQSVEYQQGYDDGYSVGFGDGCDESNTRYK